jgi:homoserine O-acetyltransferase/O-succinyltransferase
MSRKPPRALRHVPVLLCLAALMIGASSAAPLQPQHGDAILRDFRFASGEVFPQLKIHYLTLGTPARDASGRVLNAILLLHGTTGTSANFLHPGIAGELFGEGQPLDLRRYYIIVPDNLGAGKSSKPSDGLRAGFPRYRYADMVSAQVRLVRESLGVERLRLIIGTSMGGMHAWVWATDYPDLMDGVLPLVCLPVQTAGRNRMERRLISDAIRNDPAWNGGSYEQPPPGLAVALKLSLMMSASTRQLYAEAPTAQAADQWLEDQARERLRRTDANDFLYAWEASADYDPGPKLEAVRAAVIAVNFADDERYPPGVGTFEKEVKRVPRGRAVLIPAGERTRGHLSFYDAGLWKQYVAQLLAETAASQTQ